MKPFFIFAAEKEIETSEINQSQKDFRKLNL